MKAPHYANMFLLIKDDSEKKLLESTTDSIVTLIKEKGLNTRQVKILLEMVKAETEECVLS